MFNLLNKHKKLLNLGLAVTCAAVLQSCAQANVPGARNVKIPSPIGAENRAEAVNEQPDSVIYLPLGHDVLVPQARADGALPREQVGPFELRGETLAGALQLILADYDVPLAFETEEGLSRRVTVANLHGPLDRVVMRICSLADLYCAYEDGLLIIKDTQTFTVKIPPISSDSSFMSNIASGLAAIIGTTPITDNSTRTIIYETTQRNAELAMRYFQRMRSSTALIIFETYIWEVNLNSGNSTGIQWDMLDSFGKFAGNISISGNVGADFSNPVSIGLPTTQGADGGAFTPTDIFRFLSQFGAVKTISQPQVTVLSGSEARLRVADTENFVSQIDQTIDNGQTSTSVSTSSVDTGFTLSIASNWDNATVYADVEIELTDVAEIDDFAFSSGGGGEQTVIQLPRTSERELQTQVRIRPGDSLLIAGLVRENDNFNTSGPGLAKPIIPASRTAQVSNLEVVFLLRPRVVVYTSPEEADYYVNMKKEQTKQKNKKKPFAYDFAPFDTKTEKPAVKPSQDESNNTQETPNNDGKPLPVVSIPSALLDPRNQSVDNKVQ